MATKKNLIGTAEAAEIIGVSQRMILKYIEAGKIEAEKVGGHYYTTKAEARRIQRERAKALKEVEKARKAKEKEQAKKNTPAKKKAAKKPAKEAKKGGKK